MHLCNSCAELKKTIIQKLLIIIAIIIIFSNPGIAQLSFRIESNILYPDVSVRISENVIFPDIRVKIGESVHFEDFTVGITSNRNQADFIITTSRYPELTVRASENILFPDISIKAGENVLFADVTIKIKKTGTVDYIVYTEKADISLTDLVVALLPAINEEMDYKFKKIPIYVEESNQSTNISNLSEIIFLLKGASVFAQDDEQTYLGKIDNKYNFESIFNEYGTYGNEYSSKSIWNEYSKFGNKYNLLSPFNDYSSSPPMIIKNGKILGYLTTNEFILGGISPYILKGIKDKF
jgi:hypothetical protein